MVLGESIKVRSIVVKPLDLVDLFTVVRVQFALAIKGIISLVVHPLYHLASSYNSMAVLYPVLKGGRAVVVVV